MSKLIIPLMTISFVFSVLLTVSCAKTETVNQVDDRVSEKVSSQLLAQVNLRKEQIAKPTTERLELMRNMGMSLDDLEIQEVFIHLEKALNTSQIEDLQAMGIVLYLDSWIPPVGAHPTGFLTADMPVDKLNELAGEDYVVRLDTAERVLKPQNGMRPQTE